MDFKSAVKLLIASQANGDLLQYIGTEWAVSHAALNEFLVGTASDSWAKKTLSQTKTILGFGSGLDNLLFPEDAGNLTLSGLYNTAIGKSALAALTTGQYNTVLGRYAGNRITTGIQNVLIGESAGGPTSGGYNMGIGTFALLNALAAAYNTMIGHGAGQWITNGQFNIGIGRNAGYAARLTTGVIAIGDQAGIYRPATAPSGAAAAGAGLGIGTYYYRVAFTLDGDVSELSDPTAGITTTDGNQKISLTDIPTYTGPLTCSNRKLYRTKLADTGDGWDLPFYLLDTVGDNATTTYDDTTADASLGEEPSAITSSIVIGKDARFNSSNQMVVGSPGYWIVEAYFGSGIVAPSPPPFRFHATDGLGENNAGADLMFYGGRSTGNADGGSIIFLVSLPGASGTARRGTDEVFRVTKAGINLATGYKYQINGVDLAPGDVGAAPAAAGVTSGDSHAHTGGAGAQIDHGGLGGLSDDDHTQYIKHSLATATSDMLAASGAGAFVKKTLAEMLTLLGKAEASGLASLDANSKAVQNPANATATPTASKIPIADGSGKLDGWITAGSTTAAGIVEAAIASEVTTGTDTARAVTPDALAGSDYGKRIVAIKVMDDTTVLTTGDGKVYFHIPIELNGYNLVLAHAALSTVSSSGAPVIQVYNVTDSQDMLSTGITIAQSALTTYTGGAGAINTTYDDVATGDMLRIDVDTAGTGAKGLEVILTFQLP